MVSYVISLLHNHCTWELEQKLSLDHLYLHVDPEPVCNVEECDPQDLQQLLSQFETEMVSYSYYIIIKFENWNTQKFNPDHP